MVKKILLLGEEKLYQKSDLVEKGEDFTETISDLHDTLMDFKSRYQAGRAIAAPQIGVGKRIIYMYLDKPVVFINPWLEFPDDEEMEVLDDCMSFPNLYVRVKRFRRCVVRYVDAEWKSREMRLEGDLAELFQHEYDHLEGILATMRAVDDKALCMRGE
ncbi:peptide deformylase [uncultured Robinsoniella sp.]|uniref:peptide deformylase n=1 Tax=Robinsoniella sp. TaxID=2496533 RepID=UPI00374F38F4